MTPKVASSLGVVAVLCVIGYGGWWAKVNWFEAGGLFVTKNRSVDHAYRLNTKGDDLRVYEFTPDSNPKVVCVVVAGERNSTTECFQKVPEVQPNG